MRVQLRIQPKLGTNCLSAHYLDYPITSTTKPIWTGPADSVSLTLLQSPLRVFLLVATPQSLPPRYTLEVVYGVATSRGQRVEGNMLQLLATPHLLGRLSVWLSGVGDRLSCMRLQVATSHRTTPSLDVAVVERVATGNRRRGG